MKTAGVAELKAKLSSYLDQVKAGEEILVTEHGAAVAKLVPLPASDRRGSRRQRLSASGILRLGRGRVRPSLVSAPRGALRGRDVLAALLAERREGR